MDGWIHECRDGWMMDGKMDGWMEVGRIHECRDGWMMDG
jgi:hypothetical protein